MRPLTSTLLALLLTAGAHAQAGQDTAKIRSAAEAAVAGGDWATAIASYQQLVKADPKDGKAWHMLGYSLHAKGDLDEALKAHLKATEFPEVAPIATYNAACVHALRGDKQAALDWLEKAANLGFTRAEHVRDDPDMDSLRGEPRYKEILAKMEKSAVDSPRVQVFAGTFDRKLTRLVLFAGEGSVGSVSISYGQPQWKDTYTQDMDSPKLQNRRWRFGKDEWTTLDASVPLTIGDQELPAGLYYLTLERRDGEFILAALDPDTVHKHTIDPYLARQTTGGHEFALKHEKVDDVSDRLEIRLVESMGKPGSGELTVRFGPHKLSTSIALHLRTRAKEKDAK